MLLQDQVFMQKLFLEEDDENDDGEDPDSMETVVGLLQSAIVINTSGSNFNWRLKLHYNRVNSSNTKRIIMIMSFKN